MKSAKIGMKKAMPKAMPPTSMPKGQHMMPDGMPMSDAEHKKMMNGGPAKGGKKR